MLVTHICHIINAKMSYGDRNVHKMSYDDVICSSGEFLMKLSYKV